jgi:hypothetical protein
MFLGTDAEVDIRTHGWSNWLLGRHDPASGSQSRVDAIVDRCFLVLRGIFITGYIVCALSIVPASMFGLRQAIGVPLVIAVGCGMILLIGIIILLVVWAILAFVDKIARW